MIWRRIYLVVLTALFALSATRMEAGAAAYSIDLYNNTEHAIEVQPRKGSEWATIVPGRGKRVAYNEGVTIRVNDRELHFERVDPPRSYVLGGLFSMTLKAQLNSDLKIWLLQPSDTWPALHFARQPQGFPLSPR